MQQHKIVIKVVGNLPREHETAEEMGERLRLKHLNSVSHYGRLGACGTKGCGREEPVYLGRLLRSAPGLHRYVCSVCIADRAALREHVAGNPGMYDANGKLIK